MPRLNKAAKIGIINILAVVLLLVIIEGMAGYLFAAVEIANSRPIPERFHTEYDEELGWVNLPDVYIRDMYGPGVYMRTNAQRFRNEREFSRRIPDGYIRIICSGDSFTLGVGVDNEHTWCRLLSQFSRSVETVNMGQGGYGLGQAYLWYKRSGAALDHSVHLFSFITDDFRRTFNDTFQGYGKPLLTLKNDSLVVENTPVPERSYAFSRIVRTVPVLAGLNTVRLMDRLVARASAVPGNAEASQHRESEIEVVSRIFEDLDAANRARGSRLVLVYLPAPGDYMGTEDTEHWRRIVRQIADDRGLEIIDVVEEMRSLPPLLIDDMYGEHAHYSEAGNAFVAEVLRGRLGGLSAERSDSHP